MWPDVSGPLIDWISNEIAIVSVLIKCTHSKTIILHHLQEEMHGLSEANKDAMVAL